MYVQQCSSSNESRNNAVVIMKVMKEMAKWLKEEEMKKEEILLKANESVMCNNISVM